jgi:chromate transporter
MLGFAYAARALTGATAAHAMHGLKLVAVAVVAQAVWGMARTLAAGRPRAAIALAATLVATFAPAAAGQVAAIVMGAVAGMLFALPTAPASARPLATRWSRRGGAIALAVFLILLVGLPAAARFLASQPLAFFDVFYRAGALVFGGGHVVLPLLEAEIVPRHWLGEAEFLAGYGAAQAVPGPLFTFAAYLGATVHPAPHGLAGAALALVAIFLPGLLLVLGTLPFWEVLRARPRARSAIAGINAAVVGILLAALYDPVWVSAVRTPADFAVAALGFALLAVWRTPPWIVVLLTLAAALTLHLG